MIRSTRARVLVLLLVSAIVAAFGVHHVSVTRSAEGVAWVDTAFAAPPSSLATPPADTHPGAWWSNTARQVHHDGTIFMFLGIVLLAALMNVVAPKEVTRLRTSVLAFGGYVLSIPIATIFLSPDSLHIYGHIRFVALLLAGVAIVNLLALFAFEIVLRLVRIQAPSILRDLLLAGAYLAFGLSLLGRAGVNLSGIIATSAVLTAVIGFSLQDTLGNIMGGLVMQMEDTISIGDWIKVGDVTGCVKEIRWRQTTIETRNWDSVVIPNSVLMKGQVQLLGRRTGNPVQRRQYVHFNVELAVPPNVVIDAVEEALNAAPIERVAAVPRPHCIVLDFREGACVYAARYWLSDLAFDEMVDSVVRQRIYVALQRKGVRLAFPAHAISLTEEDEARRAARAKEQVAIRIAALSRVEIFKVLDAAELEELATHVRHAPFARGEIMTRQGAEAHWLYFIVSGEAIVTISKDGAERQVAELGPGQVFGEMALLTGEPRSATVVANTNAECWRLDREGFEAIIKRRPEIAKELSRILALRRVELDAVRETLSRDTGRFRALASVERDILSKITRFFGLVDEDSPAGKRSA